MSRHHCLIIVSCETMIHQNNYSPVRFRSNGSSCSLLHVREARVLVGIFKSIETFLLIALFDFSLNDSGRRHASADVAIGYRYSRNVSYIGALPEKPRVVVGLRYPPSGLARRGRMRRDLTWPKSR